MPVSRGSTLWGLLLPTLAVLASCTLAGADQTLEIEATRITPAIADQGHAASAGPAPAATFGLSRQNKIQAFDGAPEDFFGFSVAIFGNTAIVGANRADSENGAVDTGAAYVFIRHNGSWQRQAKLTADDAKAADTFGGNVAIWGDTAIVGSIRNDENGEDAGAVYVFERDRSVWRQQAKIIAPDGDAGDAFGQNIAIHGNTIVVGAPHDDDRGDGSGSVYVFARHLNRWEQRTKLTASDGSPGDLFGISVALTNDTMLVGADLNDETAIDAGAVYVFVRAGGHWVEQAKLTAQDGADTDIFGVRVALSGDTALISARRDDDPDFGVDAGSAYVFARSDGIWKQEAKLLAPDGAADDRFGRDVAIDQDIALIGAMHQDDRGENSGSAHVFKRTGSTWEHVSKLTPEDGKPGDLFGWSVAMSHGNLLVAAPQRDTIGDGSGAAYIFSSQ